MHAPRKFHRVSNNRKGARVDENPDRLLCIRQLTLLFHAVQPRQGAYLFGPSCSLE
jgi:hypothetical protein